VRGLAPVHGRFPPGIGSRPVIGRRNELPGQVLPCPGGRVTARLPGAGCRRAVPELAATGHKRVDSADWGGKHETTADGRCAAFGPAGGRGCRCGGAGDKLSTSPMRTRGFRRFRGTTAPATCSASPPRGGCPDPGRLPARQVAAVRFVRSQLSPVLRIPLRASNRTDRGGTP
jgi:hypothetical protein